MINYSGRMLTVDVKIIESDFPDCHFSWQFALVSI